MFLTGNAIGNTEENVAAINGYHMMEFQGNVSRDALGSG